MDMKEKKWGRKSKISKIYEENKLNWWGKQVGLQNKMGELRKQNAHGGKKNGMRCLGGQHAVRVCEVYYINK